MRAARLFGDREAKAKVANMESENESDVSLSGGDSDEHVSGSDDELMLDDDLYSTDPMPLEPADHARDVAAANPRDDIFRCLCGVCDPQEPDERLCCHSVARVVEMCNSAAVQCITQHPLLRDICLRRELLVVYAPQFCRYDRHFRRLNPQDHSCLRFTAYSSFTRWVWGYLRPRNRRQVPGCVVRAIRRELPSTSYQGYQR
ncbi:uncharacterized protein LOC135390176 [Ornithodoros turicata]|uniref:uncharacterized protein LOC135390176 n=1 Tax=Ornithodoros turicata TaxID=34597 RepID=UPI003139DBE7